MDCLFLQYKYSDIQPQAFHYFFWLFIEHLKFSYPLSLNGNLFYCD